MLSLQLYVVCGCSIHVFSSSYQLVWFASAWGGTSLDEILPTAATSISWQSTPCSVEYWPYPTDSGPCKDFINYFFCNGRLQTMLQLHIIQHSLEECSMQVLMLGLKEVTQKSLNAHISKIPIVRFNNVGRQILSAFPHFLCATGSSLVVRWQPTSSSKRS